MVESVIELGERNVVTATLPIIEEELQMFSKYSPLKISLRTLYLRNECPIFHVRRPRPCAGFVSILTLKTLRSNLKHL